MKQTPILHRKLLVRAPIAALILLLSLWSSAADIDIFRAQFNQCCRAQCALVLDNSANWNSNSNGVTKQQIMHEALFKFLDSLKPRFADDPDFPGYQSGYIGVFQRQLAKRRQTHSGLSEN